MFSGSIAALITPFQEDGSIDETAWLNLLDWHRQSGTRGVVVAGTTGESVTLSEGEFSRLLALALERVGDLMTVLAGTGFPSTAQTVERTGLAAELGAHAALVVTPAYNRPTQAGLEAHYRQVADSASIPVVLYNVPGRTACDLLPETVARLADHANIIAIKEAVADPARIQALLATDLIVLSGDDASCCQSQLEGAAGVISVAANVVPERFAQMCALTGNGSREAALAVDQELAELNAFLGIESNPIPAKWLLYRMGRIGAALRLPLTPLDAAYRAQADELIASLQLDVVRDVA
ncbi:MAG: 4-hydroxy-tetrahydrodipicolinate synthase [Pseudomonadota bacterium]